MSSTSTLFTDVRVFDGRSDGLSAPTAVLVTGSTITSIGEPPAVADAEQRTTIDGAGRRR